MANADWGLVAAKRKWCPEWLWKWICALTFGQLPTIQPFRWLLTTKKGLRELKG